MSYYSQGHVRFEPINQVWAWLKPDQFYGPIRESAPAPAVVRLHELDSNSSHSVRLDDRWQVFLFDLLSLSEFGVHYWVFGRKSDEFDYLNRAFEGTYKNEVCFCNPFAGYPGRANYVAGTNLNEDEPVFDQIRALATNSYKFEERINSKGQLMCEIKTFSWIEGPPANYGVEILQDPRVQFATIQKRTGVVSKFPRLVGDVPTALITNQPVYLEPYYFEFYIGPRRAPYYVPGVTQGIMNYASWLYSRARSLL